MLQLLSKKSVFPLFILICTLFQSPLWSMETRLNSKEPIPYHQRPGSEQKMNKQEGETVFYFPPCELIEKTFEKRHFEMIGTVKEIGRGVSETVIYNPKNPTVHVIYNDITYKCESGFTALFSGNYREVREEFSVTLDLHSCWNPPRIMGIYKIIGRLGIKQYCVFPLLDLTQFARIALPVADLKKNYYFKNVMFSEGLSEFNNIGQHRFDVPLLFSDKLISSRNYIKNLTIDRLILLILLKNAEPSFWLPQDLFYRLYKMMNFISFFNAPQVQFKQFDSYAQFAKRRLMGEV